VWLKKESRRRQARGGGEESRSDAAGFPIKETSRCGSGRERSGRGTMPCKGGVVRVSVRQGTNSYPKTTLGRMQGNGKRKGWDKGLINRQG